MASASKTDLLSTVILCLSPILYREIWVNCPCWLHLSILHFRVFFNLLSSDKKGRVPDTWTNDIFPGPAGGTVNSSAATHVGTTERIERSIQRLNMELYLYKVFIWAPSVQLKYRYSMAETPQPPHLGSYEGANWSAKIDDISLRPPACICTSYYYWCPVYTDSLMGKETR